MRRAFFWLGGAAAIVVGCGSSVVDPGSGGSGGATTTTTTTPGSGGAGGDVMFTTGTGGGPACVNDPTLFVDIAGDVTQHVDASCVPQGRFTFGSGPTPPGPPPNPPPSSVGIVACTAGPSFVLTVTAGEAMWPGTSMMVNLELMHDGVDHWMVSEQPALLELDTVEPTGGVFEGSFSGTVAPDHGNGMPQLHINGKFRVCHGPDAYII